MAEGEWLGEPLALGLRVPPLAACDAVAQRLPAGEADAERHTESVALVERLRVSVPLAEMDTEVVRDTEKVGVREAVPLALALVVTLPVAQPVAPPVAVAEDEPLREVLRVAAAETKRSGVALPEPAREGVADAEPQRLAELLSEGERVREGETEALAEAEPQ